VLALAKIIGNAPHLMVKSIVEKLRRQDSELLRLYRLVGHMPAAAAVGGHGGVLPLADRQMVIITKADAAI
jgi:hypothetical protein